ncbi:LysR substrate-binding domain-containing protein [Rhizobium sp. 11515TR]|uniref:LysR substrate-binding domain-containing protein n=1 Tax=Rhizobium sp. 11515TR TaxID=2028343 RepID=UPI000BA8A440|nr:hypothetical protein CKA34_28725 [Rhizobium sp. 11515TR]
MIVARAERPGILKALVRAGLGIAFLSLLGVEKEVSEGKLTWIPLGPGIMEPAQISLLTPRSRVQPVYMMEFIEIVKSEMSEHLRVNRQGSGPCTREIFACLRYGLCH